MGQYLGLPQPEDIPLREREDAMGSYLMMFASVAIGLPLPILNLIAAVIYFYINKNKSRFIHFHALQSLISQLPTTLCNMVLTGWTVRNFITQSEWTDVYFGYLITCGIFNLVYFIYSIVGAVNARKGRFYYFVFFGRIAYHYAYKNKVAADQSFENKPPQ